MVNSHNKCLLDLYTCKWIHLFVIFYYYCVFSIQNMVAANFYSGTNACYTEKLDNVPKFAGDRSKYSKVLINTEWGAFGDQGSLKDYLTEFDIALDKEDAVKNKGKQL